MNDKIIIADELEFSYSTVDEPSGSEKILKNINLEIDKGSFVAILGHNGCGKSTLAKHFNAVLLPSGGKVFVGGIDTADESRLFDIRQRAGMVFQNPDNQIVATVVEEDVAFALENLGVPPDEMRVRVDDALKSVDMYEYRMHSPHQLSGGQKQRVAIAGIIAMRPECIILDEPTAMLDPSGRREVMKTIKQLNKEHNITILIITHYMDEAAQAERVIVMDKGKIIMDDAPREVFSRVDELKAVGLDVPQVTELVHELNKAGFSLNKHIITEQECVTALCELFKTKSSMEG